MTEVRFDDIDFNYYDLIGDVWVKFDDQKFMLGRMWDCVRGPDREELFLLRELNAVELRTSRIKAF